LITHDEAGIQHLQQVKEFDGTIGSGGEEEIPMER